MVEALDIQCRESEEDTPVGTKTLGSTLGECSLPRCYFPTLLRPLAHCSRHSIQAPAQTQTSDIALYRLCRAHSRDQTETYNPTSSRRISTHRAAAPTTRVKSRALQTQ